MSPFEFATSSRILFGAGSLRRLGEEARALTGPGFVVTGRDASRAEPLRAALRSARLEWIEHPVDGEPTVELATALAGKAVAGGCRWVVSFGGGSVLDAGKAVAAFATNPGDPLRHLEVVGEGRPLTEPPLPFVAVPTTAGTGSEATRNAVLGSPAHRVKVSLRSPSMLPRLAVVDPGLTLGLPPALTASTGMDALAQLLEPWVGCRANPMTDALCREGLPRVARSLPQAFRHGDDIEARSAMSLASLWGGMALANSGLGAVHGFAGPLGGMYDLPHGALCAALLFPVWRVNCAAARRHDPEGIALRRHVEAARLLTGLPGATAEDGGAWLRDLAEGLGILSLGSLGVSSDRAAEAVAKAKASSSMKGNPVPLGDSELEEIFLSAL